MDIYKQQMGNPQLKSHSQQELDTLAYNQQQCQNDIEFLQSASDSEILKMSAQLMRHLDEQRK